MELFSFYIIKIKNDENVGKGVLGGGASWLGWNVGEKICNRTFWHINHCHFF
ncbi:GatA family leaderless bacteriocin [Lactococcus lactis]|uniref:GatA family leaderless bacteriocin n=1 Tax=Lactococcus lactis TaxID=1358 RepID=UPI00193E53E0